MVTRMALRLRPPQHQARQRAVGWWAIRAVLLVVPPLVAGLAIGGRLR